MSVAQERLSKLMSHALRHEPGTYGLTLDPEGWVPVEDLLAAIHHHGPRWADVDRAAIEAMMAAASKQRFELAGDRIRAYYGHSVPARIVRAAASPPAPRFALGNEAVWLADAVPPAALAIRQPARPSSRRGLTEPRPPGGGRPFRR